MSKIFVITCGKVYEGVADPEMTKEEGKKIASVCRAVPRNPAKIVCGLGRRHLQILELLGTSFTTTQLETNPIAGWPVVVYEIGQGTKIVKMCLLPNGRSIPEKCFKDPCRNSSAAIRLIISLPHNSLICTETQFLKLIGVGEPREKSVYEIITEKKAIQSIRIIA